MSFNPKIYLFEDALEQAVQAWLLKNGVNDAKRQREDTVDVDGKKMKLRTPRVAVQCLFEGFPTEHVWINQSTRERWLDTGYGTLYLKVVTRRDGSEPSHALLRGQCRGLMQNRGEISKLMEHHVLEKIVEQASTISFSGDDIHDISALSFRVAMTIKPLSFPQT